MKKGFTLAELLGVIIILALIAMIATPAVTSLLNNSKKKLCETQVSYIITAAKNWGADHLLQLPDEGETLTISLSELIQQGYIQGDKDAATEEEKLKIINPNTKEYFEPDPTVIIQKAGKSYTYTIDGTTENSCSGGVNDFKVTLLGIHTNIEGGIPITNQITNGSFEDGETGWTPWNGVIVDSRSATGSKSLAIINQSAWWKQSLSYANQDKLYMSISFLSSVVNGPSGVIVNSSGIGLSPFIQANPSNTFKTSSILISMSNDGNPKFFQVGVCGACSKGDSYIDDIIVINLTQTFGVGNEPSKEEMDAIGWFDGTASIASKTGNFQVDFNVSAETSYTISNRITCNSGYTTFENGILSVKGMNQDTVCKIVSIQ